MVNLASKGILEVMGVPLYPVFDMMIRTATSALTTIKYYTDVDVTVCGVSAKFRVYAIPREFNLSYGLLSSLRWTRQVKLRGNYEIDKYYIKDWKQRYRDILRNTTTQVNAVELPRVQLAPNEYGMAASMDDKTRSELELAEESSDHVDEEILHEVIGQATNVMRKQMRMDESSESDKPNSEAGNESDFKAVRGLEVVIWTSTRAAGRK